MTTALDDPTTGSQRAIRHVPPEPDPNYRPRHAKPATLRDRFGDLWTSVRNRRGTHPGGDERE